MALTTKRIIALPSQTDPQEGDYLAIDNATGGTKKIPVGKVGAEIDDTLTEAGKAADAKAVGDALDEIRSQVEVTGTASGAIATFTDGSDAPMKSCIAEIEPKQAGSGTPSPDNVRQISGWESVDVNVSGKNLLPITMETRTVNGITFTVEKDANGNVLSIAFSGTTASTVTEVGIGTTQPLKDGAYIINGCSNPNISIRLQLKKKGEAAAIVQQFNNTDQSFTAIDGTEYVVTICIVGNGMAINATVYPMIRLASISDATFEPYQGTTTTVNLGRTVYGGTLDIASGVLTSYPFYPSYNGETLNGRWVCDRAVYAEGTTPPTGSQVALVSGTGTTYTLTPTEIQTLLGENNIWADSGDVEVVYVRDLNITINNLLNSNGTRSLGMMAMSAPAEATAEEPTGEQTEEPAEDDMR